MATLYIRDVDDIVAEELKARASAEGLSLSAFVAAQLTRLTARPTNAEIVERLRSRDRSSGPTTADVVDTVASCRR